MSHVNCENEPTQNLIELLTFPPQHMRDFWPKRVASTCVLMTGDPIPSAVLEYSTVLATCQPTASIWKATNQPHCLAGCSRLLNWQVWMPVQSCKSECLTSCVVSPPCIILKLLQRSTASCLLLSLWYWILIQRHLTYLTLLICLSCNDALFVVVLVTPHPSKCLTWQSQSSSSIDYKSSESDWNRITSFFTDSIMMHEPCKVEI